MTMIGGAWLLTPERSASHKPTWLLQFESGLALARPRKVAADELVRRLRVNDLDAEQAAEVAALFLEHQSDPALAWEPAKGDFLRMAGQRKHLTPEQMHQYAERGVAPALNPRGTIWVAPNADGSAGGPPAPVLPVAYDPSKLRLGSTGAATVSLEIEAADSDGDDGQDRAITFDISTGTTTRPVQVTGTGTLVRFGNTVSWFSKPTPNWRAFSPTDVPEVLAVPVPRGGRSAEAARTLSLRTRWVEPAAALAGFGFARPETRHGRAPLAGATGRRRRRVGAGGRGGRPAGACDQLTSRPRCRGG